MGYKVKAEQINRLIEMWKKDYHVYAPRLYKGGGRFSDTDVVRYGEIQEISDVVFDKKSDYSFKEVLTPVSQTLFYFTDGQTSEASMPKKGSVIFMRSCDVHALKRLDDMYLNNGPSDYYYKALRDGIKIVLMGCDHSFDNCFCVSMDANTTSEYCMSIDSADDGFYVDCREPLWAGELENLGATSQDVIPRFVKENKVKVTIPENLKSDVAKSKMWDEYDERCIACGRCNFVCPTCTCFTMQDIFYTDNGKVGERRRVMASCMVDGYSDVAGGGSYRQKHGQRMRFKVLHKVLDYRKRKGYNMCVGCGRCDDACPEYISFSNSINKLEDAMREVSKDDK